MPGGQAACCKTLILAEFVSFQFPSKFIICVYTHIIFDIVLQHISTLQRELQVVEVHNPARRQQLQLKFQFRVETHFQKVFTFDLLNCPS